MKKKESREGQFLSSSLSSSLSFSSLSSSLLSSLSSSSFSLSSSSKKTGLSHRLFLLRIALSLSSNE